MRIRVEEAVVGLIGIGLVTWAIITPRMIPYLIGCALLAVIVNPVFLPRDKSRQATSGTASGTPRRRRMRIVRVLSPIVVFVILAGAPMGVRLLQGSPGVLWRAELPVGHTIAVAEQLYLDSTIGPLDLEDGAVRGPTEGDTVVFHDGSAATVTNGYADSTGTPVVAYFDDSGERVWESAVDAEDWATVRVHAQRDGYVVVSSCGYEESRQDSLSCRFTGMDPSGAQAWQRDADVLDKSVTLASAVHGQDNGTTLPSALPLVEYPADSQSGQYGLALIDPVSGESLTQVAAGTTNTEDTSVLTEFRVVGQQLLASGQDEEGCFVESYDLQDGQRQWHTGGFCPESMSASVPEILAPDRPDATYAYLWQHAGTAQLDRIDPADRRLLFSVDLADGAVREVDPDEVGGSETPIAEADLVDLLPVLSTSTAGDLVLGWDGTDVTATGAGDGQQRWQTSVPGQTVRDTDAAHGTLAIVTDAPGHNPYVPLPGQATGEPARVSVVAAGSGEVLSTTLFPDGVRQVTVATSQQVLVQELPPGRATLIGAGA